MPVLTPHVCNGRRQTGSPSEAEVISRRVSEGEASKIRSSFDSAKPLNIPTLPVLWQQFDRRIRGPLPHDRCI